MYEIKNLKRTPTPISLPGRSFILPGLGATNKIRDREFDTASVQAAKKQKWVKLTPIEGVEPPEDETTPEFLEYKRVTAVKAARERAARRARGELI